MGLQLLLGWGEQRGAEMPKQGLGWERDKRCRVSSDAGSVGMGACKPRLCENSSSVAHALIHCPHFQFPHFLKRC